MLQISRVFVLVMFNFYTAWPTNAQCFQCANVPKGTIFCDDFENEIELDKKYFEINNNQGDFIRMDSIGRDHSHGMRVKWQKGEVSAGGLSKSFGKTPSNYIGKNATNPTESYKEIYWRMDVRSQKGWTGGGPAKLSRALCFANSNWAQGMMAHVWSGGPNNLYLGIDPATGIGTDGKLKSTKYNDFANLRWLGFKAGNIDLYSTENSDKWYCIVARVKLNTPGIRDGIFELWINDTLQASSTNLDWHSTWNNDPNNLHINAVFFENYWNNGSPVEQERYFDNIVISTEPIPCKCDITSTNHSSTQYEFKIKTNPLYQTLQLELPFNLLPLDVFIYDLDGYQISKHLVSELKTNVDVSSLKNGLYFLKANGFNPLKFVIGK